MRIAFIWQGFDGRYGQWRDGLYAAMKLIEKDHTVRYFDFPLTGIHDFKPDIVLYWEAPITICGKDAANYRAVQELPYKKALLFAGGEIRKDWVKGFDLLFVESGINEVECASLKIPFKRAFGVNTSIFKPEKQPKRFDGFLQATYALWKRHDLFARAFGESGVTAGRKQAHEPQCYESCEKYGVLTLPELPADAIASIINASWCVANTSEYWGGGQRCTLEAMACAVPVIVMKDSPKNCEYVEESNGGIICDPDPNQIRDAINTHFKAPDNRYGERGYNYVMDNWTEYHYRDAILEGINSL